MPSTRPSENNTAVLIPQDAEELIPKPEIHTGKYYFFDLVSHVDKLMAFKRHYHSMSIVQRMEETNESKFPSQQIGLCAGLTYKWCSLINLAKKILLDRDSALKRMEDLAANFERATAMQFLVTETHEGRTSDPGYSKYLAAATRVTGLNFNKSASLSLDNAAGIARLSEVFKSGTVSVVLLSTERKTTSKTTNHRHMFGVAVNESDDASIFDSNLGEVLAARLHLSHFFHHRQDTSKFKFLSAEIFTVSRTEHTTPFPTVRPPWLIYPWTTVHPVSD